MAHERWQEELEALRREPQAVVEMRMRWSLRQPRGERRALLAELLRPAPKTELWLTLYPAGPGLRARPVVEVLTAPDDRIRSVRQGATVEVAGRVETGGAVVVIPRPGFELWPQRPARAPARRRTL